MSTQSIVYRENRSFVRREGRLTPGQQRALDAHWVRYDLQPEEQTFSWDSVFGRSAPRVLEIGFGNGDALFQMAQHYPAYDFIGIEVHRPGVGHLLLRAAEADLSNLRVFCADAVPLLKTCFADASLARAQIFFPDPWPKKRHHKRRLIQPGFVALMAAKLQQDGLLHIATDWAQYAEHIQATLATSLDFTPLAEHPLAELALERPVTKYEQRGKRLGHAVYDLLYRHC